MNDMYPGPDDIISRLSVTPAAGMAKLPDPAANGIVTKLSASKAPGKAPVLNTAGHITRADVKGAT